MSYSSKLFCNFVVSVLAPKRGLHASICFYARFSVNRPPSFQSKEATEGWPSVRCSQREWNLQHLYNLHLDKSSINILHHLSQITSRKSSWFLYCCSLERCINVACIDSRIILLFFVCSLFNTHTHTLGLLGHFPDFRWILVKSVSISTWYLLSVFVWIISDGLQPRFRGLTRITPNMNKCRPWKGTILTGNAHLNQPSFLKGLCYK